MIQRRRCDGVCFVLFILGPAAAAAGAGTGRAGAGTRRAGAGAGTAAGAGAAHTQPRTGSCPPASPALRLASPLPSV